MFSEASMLWRMNSEQPDVVGEWFGRNVAVGCRDFCNLIETIAERSADGVSCTVSAILQSFPSILRSAAVTRPACEWAVTSATSLCLTVFSCWLWNALNFVGCGLVTGHISSLRCCRVLVLQCVWHFVFNLWFKIFRVCSTNRHEPPLFAPFTQHNVIDAVSPRFHPGVTIQFDYWMSSSHWDKKNLRCFSLESIDGGCVDGWNPHSKCMNWANNCRRIPKYPALDLHRRDPEGYGWPTVVPMSNSDQIRSIWDINQFPGIGNGGCLSGRIWLQQNLILDRFNRPRWHSTTRLLDKSHCQIVCGWVVVHLYLFKMF